MLTPETPCPSLNSVAGVPVYVKREDLHPYGSHKGRSIPHMIDKALEKGVTKFVISSSGNAALASAIHINRLANVGVHAHLTIFIGNKIPEYKQKMLTDRKSAYVEIHQVERPLQEATALSKEGHCLLRQSTDDTALFGYHSLASEILNTPNLSAVFVATSSGTTAQALHTEFKKHHKNIEIHIVQTTALHPIALPFDDDRQGESVTNAIADQVAHRRTEAQNAVRESNGGGWIVSDEDIREAQNYLKRDGIDVTENGAISVAGLLRASGKERLFRGSVVCIIGGR
jgi:threonine dehydratase